MFGLPHTKTLDPRRKDCFTTCAFTMKAWNLCKAMYERGHEVIHLGTEGSEPICTKHISVTSHEDWQALYGDRPKEAFYNIDIDGKYAPYMAKFAENSKKALLDLGGLENSSIVCVTWGGAQQVATQGVPQFIVESGIGYPCAWAKYRVYESYAWMHFHLGKDGCADGTKWYHCVIPNMFDSTLFGPVVKEKKDYALYLGRLLESKGTHIAIRAAIKAGLKIKLVGQGNPLPFMEDPEVPNDKRNLIEYIGPVKAKQRRKLLREAKLLLCPTQYIEPFGGVAVEAAMSGTPVVSTDWGAFPETVQHGLTGYRCRTFEQFIWAIKNIDNIDPKTCYKWAKANYSLERVGKKYEEFFNQIMNLRTTESWGKLGWAREDDSRTQLDWLKTDYSMFRG